VRGGGNRYNMYLPYLLCFWSLKNLNFLGLNLTMSVAKDIFTDLLLIVSVANPDLGSKIQNPGSGI